MFSIHLRFAVLTIFCAIAFDCDATVRRPIAIAIAFVAILAGSFALFTIIPGEYTPQEDRGSFQIMITGPEGASFEYMQPFIEQIEGRLLPMIEQGEIEQPASAMIQRICATRTGSPALLP